MDLVVDTWVLCRAAEGDRRAIEVLKKIYCNCHRICCDEGGKILQEYRGKIKDFNDTFVAQWFKLISSRKIKKVKIKKRIKRDIVKDKWDRKFVNVCLNLKGQGIKYIISEDYKFVDDSGNLLKIRIELLDLDKALKIL